MKKVILIIVIGLLFGVQSCRDEILLDSPFNKLKSQSLNETIIENAMNWVKDNSLINNSSLHESMELLKWEHALVHKHDSANIIEVPVKLKNKYDLKIKEKIGLNVEYRILIIQKEEKTYSLLEFLISADSKENLQNIKKINYSNLNESFRGTMLLTDNKGQEIMLKEYLSEPGVETNLKSAQIHCLALVYNYSDGTYDIISILYCYTTESGTSSTGGGSNIPNIVPEDCECSICAVCGGCLSILKSIPVPGDETEETLDCPMCSCPEVIEDNSFVNSKADCVKNKLENGSILNTLLAGFDLDQSLIDVTYKVGDLNGENGECFLNGTRIDITIDQDSLNATSMQLANTILHETFHAYIYGKLYDGELHTGLCPEPNFDNDFEAYKQQFGDQSQHNYMANKYLEYMRSGLQNYFYGESYRNNFLNYVEDMTQWYGEQNLMECLAWSGLKGTVAWSEYYSNQTNKTKYDETMQFIVPLLSKENCNN